MSTQGEGQGYQSVPEDTLTSFEHSDIIGTIDDEEEEMFERSDKPVIPDPVIETTTPVGRRDKGGTAGSSNKKQYTKKDPKKREKPQEKSLDDEFAYTTDRQEMISLLQNRCHIIGMPVQKEWIDTLTREMADRGGISESEIHYFTKAISIERNHSMGKELAETVKALQEAVNRSSKMNKEVLSSKEKLDGEIVRTGRMMTEKIRELDQVIKEIKVLNVSSDEGSVSSKDRKRQQLSGKESKEEEEEVLDVVPLLKLAGFKQASINNPDMKSYVDAVVPDSIIRSAMEGKLSEKKAKEMRTAIMDKARERKAKGKVDA